MHLTFHRRFVPFGFLLMVMLAVGCAPAPAPSQTTAARGDDALVQFSLIGALASSDYVHDTRLDTVLARGDFGIGTFNRLDGEMIVLDGRIFQARGDGTVRRALPNEGTPFAAVTFFGEDGRLEKFAAASLEDLNGQLDRKLPRRNVPYAIRIDAKCNHLTLRSVPAQTPPYRPLVEIVKRQPTWEHQDVRGTFVGLRCPAWIGTLNVAGYHWHFLSDDRRIGGHVLACDFADGTLRYDECRSLVIELPKSAAFESYRPGETEAQDIDLIERSTPSTPASH